MIVTPLRVTAAGDRTRLIARSGHTFQAPGVFPGCRIIAMVETTTTDNALWTATLGRVRGELANLPATERIWFAVQVARIGSLQEDLDRLFGAIGGPELCATCLGGCCGGAKHHATLTNLLGYLLDGEEPPSPDFSRTCPFLGSGGCRLSAACRPFNCIIFLCEALDGRLTDEQRQLFVHTECQLRAAYEAVAALCPGASLRGLLLAAARVGDRPLLPGSVSR